MVRNLPPQQPPPVQRLLIQYGKRGRMRFASHRDFARSFERALRRAEVPMAYSSGFHPHPRISYINPTFTGAESEAEYLVVGLRCPVDSAEVRGRLGAAMPEGLPILSVVEGVAESKFEASLWQVEFAAAVSHGDGSSGPEPLSELESACRTVLAAAPGSLLVTRETKNGPRQFDIREPLVELRVVGAAQLRMLIRHSEPLVRPDDVVQALRGIVSTLPEPTRLLRCAQGPLVDLADIF